MNEQRNMMDAVYTNGFAAAEARLFLDTHPESSEALDYYRKKIALYNQAVDRYQQKYGPIRPEDGGISGAWAWAAEPFPWEGGM